MTNETLRSFYNFEVFLNDDVEPTKERKFPGRRAFYELFEKDWKFKEGSKKFSGLESVLLLTFAVSRELLRPLLDKGIRMVLASDCGTNISKTIVQREEDFPNFLTILPKKNFKELALTASFHPKLFMLKFNDRLRVIIGNGNLLVQDWSFWDNAFWSKDYMLPFPKEKEDVEKSADSENKEYDSMRFGRELQRYVTFSMGDKWDLVSEFLNFSPDIFSFSEDEACLVTSLPGQWTATDSMLTGLYQIREALKICKPATPFTLENTSFLYVASSIGSLNLKLLSDFAEAVYSDEKCILKGTLAERNQMIKSFSVIYPSRQYVVDSIHGDRTTSCLFLRKSEYKSFKFPKTVLKCYQRYPGEIGNESETSKERIPHLKIAIVTNSESEVNDDTVIYIGSHNFTSAAWGKFEKDKPQSLVFNYELGVILPPRVGSKAAKEQIVKTIGVRMPTACFDQDNEPFFSTENK